MPPENTNLEEVKPPWKPSVAAGMSFLLGPFAGAFATYANLKRLGHPRKAGLTLAYVFPAAALVLAVLFWLPHEAASAGRAIGSALEFGGAALFLSLQKNEFAAWKTANPGVRERSWVKALGWGLLGIVALVVVGIGISIGQEAIVDGLVHRAEQLAKSSHYAEAEKLYRSAFNVDRDSALPHFALAQCYAGQKKWSEAIVEYQAGLQRQSGNYYGHYDLGVVYNEAENPDKAIAEFREALKFKSDFPEAHRDLGRALLSAKHDIPGAIGEFKEFVRLNPDDGDGHCLLANAYLTGHDLKAARGEMATATKLGASAPGCKLLEYAISGGRGAPPTKRE